MQSVVGVASLVLPLQLLQHNAWLTSNNTDHFVPGHWGSQWQGISRAGKSLSLNIEAPDPLLSHWGILSSWFPKFISLDGLGIYSPIIISFPEISVSGRKRGRQTEGGMVGRLSGNGRKEGERESNEWQAWGFSPVLKLGHTRNKS